jgi:uncharacterized membrane protein YfcA
VELEPIILLALCGVGLVAGFVDAIAGGGGLIAIPALLSVGVPPVIAFGTNKVQSIIGTGMAAYTYWRQGLVDLRSLLPGIVVAFGAGFIGAFVVKRIDVSVLNTAVPAALIVIALYFMFAPKLSDADRQARLNFALFVPVMGFAIGFYDGLFGPGTGSFLTMGFVTLFGLGLTRAAGHTKFVNLASNIGGLALFIPSGDVIWSAAAAMAVGQLAGGYLGARTGIRFGAKIIRPLVVVVSIAMAVRLLVFR